MRIKKGKASKKNPSQEADLDQKEKEEAIEIKIDMDMIANLRLKIQKKLIKNIEAEAEAAVQYREIGETKKKRKGKRRKDINFLIHHNLIFVLKFI